MLTVVVSLGICKGFIEHVSTKVAESSFFHVIVIATYIVLKSWRDNAASYGDYTGFGITLMDELCSIWPPNSRKPVDQELIASMLRIPKRVQFAT